MYLPGRILTSQPVLSLPVLVATAMALASCAGTPEGGQVQPRKTVDCPANMMLICEGRGEPSRGGDEEIPDYDRCFCRPAPN